MRVDLFYDKGAVGADTLIELHLRVSLSAYLTTYQGIHATLYTYQFSITPPDAMQVDNNTFLAKYYNRYGFLKRGISFPKNV